jgi:hypothetical protein
MSVAQSAILAATPAAVRRSLPIDEPWLDMFRSLHERGLLGGPPDLLDILPTQPS